MLHENILKFIQTVSVKPEKAPLVGIDNVVEITREIDRDRKLANRDRKLANSGTVKVKIPESEVSFRFDNDTGELLYIVNYKD